MLCIHEGGNATQICLACCWATQVLFREKFTLEMSSREFTILGEFDQLQTTTPGNSFTPKGGDTKRGPRG